MGVNQQAPAAFAPSSLDFRRHGGLPILRPSYGHTM